MPRPVAIGEEFFEPLRAENTFYVDKTDFIRRWWDDPSRVTAIMRPRQFGRTLTLDTVKHFFSAKYASRADLFEGLLVWREERFRNLQGTCPVLLLSLVHVKYQTFEDAKSRICGEIQDLYWENDFLLKGDLLNEEEKACFRRIGEDMTPAELSESLLRLMEYLFRFYGKKVILLIDEYDAPLQAACEHGYLQELILLLRPLYAKALQGNPYLERALITGVTGFASASLFPDAKLITTASAEYADCFGFTEQEVCDALKEYGLSGKAKEVREWYGGFAFGGNTNLYNPWSLTNFLRGGKWERYWQNSTRDTLILALVQKCDGRIREDLEELLQEETIETILDTQAVLNGLEEEKTVWGLLLASGYVKVAEDKGETDYGERVVLTLTNGEVKRFFGDKIRRWFADCKKASWFPGFY